MPRPKVIELGIGDGPTAIEDFSVHGCDLDVRALPMDDPKQRTVLRRGTVVDCYLTGAPTSAVFEDLTIDGLRTPEDVFLRGCLFRHVTIRGKCGSVIVRPWWRSSDDPATLALERSFRASDAAYYRTVDWALDITAAQFAECELKGIPADLVRRDAAEHFVVRRLKILDGRWRQRAIKDTYFELALEQLVKGEMDDVVLVAPKRARDYPRLLAALQDLRAAGIAEPG